MMAKFRDRTSAGQQLAQRLQSFAHRSDVIVLALPRGGVPVAVEIAASLHCPLDLCCVRKLGVPSRPELAFGAIAGDGVRVLNTAIINELKVSQRQQQQIEQRERQELRRREQLYREQRPYSNLIHHTAILVDDGLATGSTMQAAITFLKQRQVQTTIVAVPVAPPSIDRQLQQMSQIVCLAMPDSLGAIGCWYEDFHQVTDAEIQQTLRDWLPPFMIKED